MLDERDKFGRFIKGRKVSQRIKDKISKTETGKKLSDETKAKMSASRTGNKNYNWKGGLHMRKDGYVQVSAGKKRLYHHRIVFEQAIGRKLKPKTAIHHIDGNPANNELENLYMFRTNKMHKRVEAFLTKHNINNKLKTNYKNYELCE